MSETQANAWIRATENQYLKPAEEETKRSREETKRTIATQAITAVVVVIALGILAYALLAALKMPNSSGSIIAIVGAIATVVGVLAAPTIIKQFRK